MKFISWLLALATLGRENVWDEFETQDSRWTMLMFHNGKRPLYQVLRKEGHRWIKYGEAQYSPAWANTLMERGKEDVL